VRGTTVRVTDTSGRVRTTSTEVAGRGEQSRGPKSVEQTNWLLLTPCVGYVSSCRRERTFYLVDASKFALLKTARGRDVPRGFESHALRYCDVSGHAGRPNPSLVGSAVLVQRVGPDGRPVGW
jgi:hypothetical protein